MNKIVVNIEFSIVFWKNKQALEARNADGSRKYKYIINCGSSRSSKTYSLIDLLDEYARKNNNERITIWRDTKTDCKKTVLHDILKHHKTTGRYKLDYEFNKTESIFYYNHGGNEESTTTIEIHGTDDEETVHGLTQNIAWLNEPYKISEDTFNQIDMRSDVVFVDYNPKKDTYLDDIAKQDNAIVIHSTFRDNPFCPTEQRIKILSYQPLTMSSLILGGKENLDFIRTFENIYTLQDYIATKDYSKFDKSELARCFKNERQRSSDEYDWKVYGLGEKSENPNKIHHGWLTIPDYRYEKIKKQNQGEYPVYYGLDYGFVNPAACVEIMYDGDRTFYLKEILYKPISKMDKPLGDELILAGVPIGDVTYIFADSSDRDTSNNTNLTNDLRAYHSLNVIPVNKPGHKERFEFMKKCIIVYTTSSKNINYEYGEYQWEYINGYPTEKPLKIDDHIMNAIEYGMWMIKEVHKIKL